MRYLDYVEVDYNMPRRQHADGDSWSWIARCSTVRPPLVGDLVGIGDGEIDGGGICIGRIVRVDPEVRSSRPLEWSFDEEWIYVRVAPINFEIVNLGDWSGYQ